MYYFITFIGIDIIDNKLCSCRSINKLPIVFWLLMHRILIGVRLSHSWCCYILELHHKSNRKTVPFCAHIILSVFIISGTQQGVNVCERVNGDRDQTNFKGGNWTSSEVFFSFNSTPPTNHHLHVFTWVWLNASEFFTKSNLGGLRSQEIQPAPVHDVNH